MNDNGERFADLCATSNLVIGGSLFQHRRIHKDTWTSSDLQTEDQIDHMCIGRKFRRTLQDVRVRRGADLASDHHLLVARLNCTESANQRLAYNTFLLNGTNEQTSGIHHHALWLRLQRVKGVVTSTCNEVLGRRNTNHKGWISTETLNKIDETKAKKTAVNNSRTRTVMAQEEHKGVNRSVKRSLKTDKRSYLGSLAAEAEEAAYHENMRDLYAAIRNLRENIASQRDRWKTRMGNQYLI